MSALLWNVLLAVAWTAVTGELSPANLALGFALGFVILAATRQAIGVPHYPTKLRGIFGLLLFFLWELLLSNARVARDVLRPRTHIHPAVVALPLEAKSDAEITLLAGMITLTPGSTTIDVSPDRRLLLVHVMNIEGSSPEGEVRVLKAGFERRLLEVMR
jgi:multicomponent Na+:H+ antiporter subunit E